MKKKNCIILCGGAGSRLWPLSSKATPKQFLKFGGDLSPFQATLKRACLLSDDTPVIVCHTSHESLVRLQAADVGHPNIHILLEPLPKNTTMGVLCGLAWIQKHNDQSDIIVMPADHVIRPDESFIKDVHRACTKSMDVDAVLLGINPTYPATAYGYVHVQSKNENEDVKPVTSFEEKPAKEKAAEYLASGQYYWNSGIFLFDQQRLTAAATTHVPDILAAAQSALDAASKTKSGSLHLSKDSFEAVTSISIDYGLIEKLKTIALVPASFQWSDIGSFKSLWDQGLRDDHNNVTVGKVGVMNTSSCYIHSEGPVVTTLGVDNLSIVATKNNVLVANLHQTEKVRDVKTLPVVETVKNTGITHRPWGQFSTLDQEGRLFHVKKIMVRPGQILSLQKHKFRAEHWIILQGQARVIKDDTILSLSVNDHVYIPKGAVHRIENVGTDDVIFIEVQTGTYFGEDDIIRLEDAYGRNSDDK